MHTRTIRQKKKYVCLGYIASFAKGRSVGFFLFFYLFSIFNILIFCKIAAQDAPHALLNNRAFLLFETKKQSEENDAKQYFWTFFLEVINIPVE